MASLFCVSKWQLNNSAVLRVDLCHLPVLKQVASGILEGKLCLCNILAVDSFLQILYGLAVFFRIRYHCFLRVTLLFLLC